MATLIRTGFSNVRDYLREDNQAHTKVAAILSSVFASYFLSKLETNLILLANYLAANYSTLLIGIAIAALFAFIVLFQNEILKQIEKSRKDMDPNILNAVGASICFFVFGMFFVYFFGNSQINQLNGVKNFDLAQFKLDFNEKFYLDNDLVTESHLKDLRKNFNAIIKALNKNLKQEAKAPVADADTSEDINKLYIDGDIIAMYSYLEKTLPLYLVNEAEMLASASREPTKIQYVVSIILAVTAIYLVTKALFAKMIHEINAQIEEQKQQQSTEMVEVEETIEMGPEQSFVSTKEPVEVTEVAVQTDVVEELVKEEIAVVEEPPKEAELNVEELEEPKSEPVVVEQVVVEYCLNCERQKNLDEVAKEESIEDKRDITPYRTHNPFKKSIQNLNRAEMTQMSYPGGSSYDDLHQTEDGIMESHPYEQLVNEDEHGQINYADEEVYEEEQQQQSGYGNDQDQDNAYGYQEEVGEYGEEEDGYINDKDAALNAQAQQESEYNRGASSLSSRIIKQAASTMSLSGGQSFNDLLCWMLFNELEVDADLAINYVNLLNVLTNDVQITDDYEDINSSEPKPGDVYFKSIDTLPPKFSHIQTVGTSADSLTLKAFLDFSNIEMKAELKRTQHPLDITVLNASAQVLVVLSQSQNGLFNMECSMDPDADCIINIKQDPEIDQILVEHLKSIFKEAAKQTIVNLELNFLSKKITNSRETSTQLNMNQNVSSQINNQLNSITIKTQKDNSAVEEPTTPVKATPSPQPKKAGLDNEKRLLVKLIKATNLANCEEPYCVVELDYPMQKHITDIQEDMSTIGEQFLFDVVANSEELTFSVFDRAKDYGNDLVGEAVLPVADLCSAMSSKRVVQLHRYGHTKTGSITAEFIFIEPEGSPQPPAEEEMLRHDSLNSRSSMQRNGMLFQQEDPMLLTTQRLLNPELLSNGSYSSTAPVSSTQSAPFANQTSLRASSSGPKINRNYLQVQANSYRANRSRLGTSQNDINTLPTSNSGSEPKRTRSISRSVRNLFSGSKSRDKSYDSNSIHNSNNINYDVASETDGLKKSKSIGRSIKKLFTIGKNNSGRGTVVEGTIQTTRPESVGPTGRLLSTTLTSQRQYLYDSSHSVNNMIDPSPLQQQRSSSIIKQENVSP